VLPAIYRIYGLSWADIEDMPRAERIELLTDLASIVGADTHESG
jgi:hypothetical protein